MQLGYVIIYVPDVKAAITFYEKAFGLAVGFADETGDFAQMSTGTTSLAFAKEGMVRGLGVGFTPLRPDAEAPGVEIALTTTDVPAALAAALAMGASLVKGAEKKPWGQTVAYVRDPFGLLVELCTPMG